MSSTQSVPKALPTEVRDQLVGAACSVCETTRPEANRSDRDASESMIGGIEFRTSKQRFPNSPTGECISPCDAAQRIPH